MKAGTRLELGTCFHAFLPWIIEYLNEFGFEEQMKFTPMKFIPRKDQQ
jgi:hypothetical protein